MSRRFSVVTLALLLVAGTALAGKKYSHQEYFEHYEGTSTCLACHEDEAETFFHSQHYQWKAKAPNVVASHDQALGKINMINDFCTNPVPNWIEKVTNDEGKVLELGCSKCHAGLGKLPSTEMSREQLENIDCLICHASGYRRDLYENEDGELEWKPILWKNREGIDSVSKRISLPTKTMCLRCHAGSGGGPNYKRGDIEYYLTEADYDFDVHMDVDGNDMQCIDCHAGADHKIPGPGADIAGDEMPEKQVRCDNGDCHGSAPHTKALLNTHAERVFCTSCHIPEFAKEDATNMTRDWSAGHWDEAKGKYTYTGTFASNVTPAYQWWNGEQVTMQLSGEPVKTNAAGEVMVSVPVGSKDDPQSKIFAFKLYKAVMPVLKDKKWLLPIQTGDFYKHGDMDQSVRIATEQYYGIKDAEFEWMPTIHYMGLFHEVTPAYSALRCLDCHGPDTRLNWTELGYTGDPLAQIFQPSH